MGQWKLESHPHVQCHGATHMSWGIPFSHSLMPKIIRLETRDVRVPVLDHQHTQLGEDGQEQLLLQ